MLYVLLECLLSPIQDATKSKQFLPFLQRSGKTTAVVEVIINVIVIYYHISHVHSIVVILHKVLGQNCIIRELWSMLLMRMGFN